MKKKVAAAVLFVLILSLSIFSFAGCLGRKPTLELLDVWQSYDGRLVLDIKDFENITTKNLVQVSFDGGGIWITTKIESSNSIYLVENKSFYCVAKVPESKYGKICNITVRLAEDKNSGASKKSNIIEYHVKKPCDFYVESSDPGVFEIEYDDHFDLYYFVYENDNTILKKYYKAEEGIGEILPVKEQDKLDFEYKIYKKEDVPEQYIDWVKSHSNDEEDIESIERFAYYIFLTSEFCGAQYNNETGFKDFDYQNGISKEEYGEGVKVVDDEKTERRVCFAIRVKENETTLHSLSAIISIVLLD